MIRTQEHPPEGSFGHAFAQLKEYEWLRQCDLLRDGIVRHGYAYLDHPQDDFKGFLMKPHAVLTHLTHERILHYALRDFASPMGYLSIPVVHAARDPFARGELLTVQTPEPRHAVVLRLNIDHPEARLWMHTQRTPDISLLRSSLETIIETASLLLLHEEVGTATMLTRGETMSIMDEMMRPQKFMFQE